MYSLYIVKLPQDSQYNINSQHKERFVPCVVFCGCMQLSGNHTCKQGREAKLSSQTFFSRNITECSCEIHHRHSWLPEDYTNRHQLSDSFSNPNLCHQMQICISGWPTSTFPKCHLEGKMWIIPRFGFKTTAFTTKTFPSSLTMLLHRAVN